MHPPHHLQMPTAAVTPRPRPKRATATLNEAARARLAVLPSCECGDSSGSEHEAAALSSLVNEYLLGADSTVHSADHSVDGSDAEDEHDGGTRSDEAAEVLDEIKCIPDPAGSPDELQRQLVADVVDAMHGLEDVRPDRSAFRRAVMSRLRDRGHQAGLCKARWEKSSNMAAGSYEYIDVVVTSDIRYIVDVGFAAEFQVARPTLDYEVIRAGLPEVMVARPEDVRKVVKAATKAARHSLKSSGLSVPPWRKRRFMMAKWLGPYKRTVNSVPASAGAAMLSSGAAPVCRTIIGFAPPPPMMTSSGLWG